jgi:alpha-L-fucosidase 2
MNIRTLLFVACLFVFALPVAGAEPAGPLTLWYQQPAVKWSAEALPVGNGRLGGMLFGGVDRERLQFNEDSLWTGDDNPSGDYDSMGAYQNFGDLFLVLDPSRGGSAEVTCPSEHTAYYATEEIAFSVDGSADTKWCVEHKNREIVWQAAMPADAPAATSYSFTTCPDFPGRDPKTWELTGSMDGKAWTVLDRRADQPALGRRETKRFEFTNDKAYQLYRITFQPTQGMAHLQIAEIGLPGFSASAKPESDYRRQLDLATATADVEFVRGGVRHRREVFASHPAQVIVIRWTADKPGALSARLELKCAHGAATQADGQTLSFRGALGNGLRYEAIARVNAKGGTVRAVDGALQLDACDEATVLLAAGTDYAMDAGQNFRGADPHQRLLEKIEAAAARPYDALRNEHVADYRALFDRCQLTLAGTPAEREALPTDKRRALYASEGNDPALEALLFAYGRYLLIACSRPGGLPANLQGLWNDSNSPPWHSDYHTNINVQMNYWPAEPANLAECHRPLLGLVESQLELWRKATAAAPEFAASRSPSGRTRGWAVRTSHNIMGGMGWKWDNTANAWYAQHFYWHYAFGGDRDYLRRTAYPVLKEVCQFWEDQLKTLDDGRLVVPRAWSPEHGPTEDGVSYSQQIVWELFSNYVEAADALGVDGDYRQHIAAMRDKLVGPKIGQWGQLQEWMTDRDDPKSQHRHTSHLFAVFPGRQISMAKTPELARAAAVSLAARGEAGDSRRSWTWPWRCALWARFGRPDDAHRMIGGLLSYNTLPNLFTDHPPFQMDGNFGFTAAVCELLLQSQAGEVNLLPALPKAWATGSVTGLRARGGFTVDMAWDDGTLATATIRAAHDGPCTVRYGDKTATLSLKAGESRPVAAQLK